MDKRLEELKAGPTDVIPKLEDVEIGQWYWVTTDKDDRSYDEGEELCIYCVRHIGSNYISFIHAYGHCWDSGKRYDRNETSFRLHFDEFEDRCRREPNWEQHFNNRIDAERDLIEMKTRQLITLGNRLQIISSDDKTDRAAEETLLPSTVISDPTKYKHELVEFRDETMPEIQHDIAGHANELAVAAKNLSISNKVKLERVQKALMSVDDRIFTIEIYAGITEEAKHILSGVPARTAEPISIRQQLLFMDEESLIDYGSGGIDYASLDDFDDWLARPANMNRILPEQKSIVAFRVRRKDKDYGPTDSIAQAMQNLAKNMENMETYLLIRNGGNLYRIITAINFSPRLVPFRDEIGEKQFTIVHEGDYEWVGKGKDHRRVQTSPDEIEIVGPDDVEYDDHVNKMDGLIKKYNRIFILLQGILDRSQIFSPHPGIKLNTQAHMDEFVVCIRDEEDGLPNNTISFEVYKDELNKSLKKGDWIYSDWHQGYRWSDSQYGTAAENKIASRPLIARVTSIRRDRSEVRLTWKVRSWAWNAKNEFRNQHCYIAMEHVFNLSGYTKGDYKMFLCDRALQGQYLEWAPRLLSAEDGNFERYNEAL